MNLVDTHCHIQFPDYGLDPDQVLAAAVEKGVTKLLCVGCTLEDSQLAVSYAKAHDNAWASIGIHPHESSIYEHDHHKLQQFRNLVNESKVVAIGEIGLDYYYDHSPKEAQQNMLRYQLEIAQEHDLPVIFHVRDAFSDFWPILDAFPGVRGVIHSFTATKTELEEIVSRGLHVGLNGIMTFTKNPDQLAVAKQVPINSLLLETDAPYLTPVPFRGSICEPRHVLETAAFLANLRGESLAELASATTQNAEKLFGI